MKYFLILVSFVFSGLANAVTLSQGVDIKLQQSDPNSSLMLYMPRILGPRTDRKQISIANGNQYVSFKFRTGTHFLANPNAHVAVIVTGNPNQNPAVFYNEGRGIVIGNTKDCEGGIQIEHFNSVPDLYPSTCTLLPLDQDKTYRVAVHADLSGVSYRVYDESGVQIAYEYLHLPPTNTHFATRRDIMIFEVGQTNSTPLQFYDISDGFY